MDSGQFRRSNDVARGLRAARAGLERHCAAIDRLNVFPVPDGDTGHNMLATLTAGVVALDQLDDLDSPDWHRTIAKATLLGARGNSGVILSQILQAVLQALTSDVALEDAWHQALAEGSRAATSAVLSPKQGTILSVIAAGAVAEVGTIRESLAAMRRALLATPEQLEVLARAGVVDSGGAGLIVVLESLAEALGVEVDDAGLYPWLDHAGDITDAVLPDLSTVELESAGESEMRFEVMFSLESGEQQIEAMKTVWSGIGDSIVVVGAEGVYRCHIHTNEIGPSIEAGIQAGRVSDINVTDLIHQIDELSWVSDGLSLPATAVHDQQTAVVAVAAGAGVARLFKSFGVQSVVVGGQGKNPSIKELLDAVESANSSSVLLLPNNSNIQAAAQSVVSLVDKQVEIIPTLNVLEGFSALMAFDPESDRATNLARMTEAARRVAWGEVTTAVRAGTYEHGSFRVGSYIGLSADGIRAADDDLETVVLALLASLVHEGSEIVTLLVGEGVDAHLASTISRSVEESYPQLTVEVLHGDQPLYPFLVGVE
ncbi:DAK2 domain-containing protein [Ferrimicrobium acidiphilum]|uniref:DAK2 domain-containing protein n=1 Tax=Ferrimicrobium acidiphilum TaxID=121039 RepID=UPI0023F149FD|nr:DAK2 domain-containing protein [Ferrimicrobium acidiphilum]